jgi:hypothetical protein
MRYRALESDEIINTITALGERIERRFPRSDLTDVCGELLVIARETEAKSQLVDAPNYWLRFIIFGLIVTVSAGFFYAGSVLQLRKAEFDVTNFFPVLEAVTNLVVLVGLAIIFLFTIESRMARTRALSDLNELRSIIHVIDMHQLSKDPSALLGAESTGSMSRPDLARYLGYCSIMLSLGAKLAALYAQKLPDAVVIDASSDLQNVANGLSLKIWQKIAILETYEDHGSGSRGYSYA